MAIQVPTTISGKLFADAYVRVLRTGPIEPGKDIEITVYVYRNSLDRVAERAPEEQYTISIPFTPEPFAAAYAALKLAYLNSKDV